jgi:hypothetical protein
VPVRKYQADHEGLAITHGVRARGRLRPRTVRGGEAGAKVTRGRTTSCGELGRGEAPATAERRNGAESKDEAIQNWSMVGSVPALRNAEDGELRAELGLTTIEDVWVTRSQELSLSSSFWDLPLNLPLGESFPFGFCNLSMRVCRLAIDFSKAAKSCFT